MSTLNFIAQSKNFESSSTPAKSRVLPDSILN